MSRRCISAAVLALIAVLALVACVRPALHASASPERQRDRRRA